MDFISEINMTRWKTAPETFKNYYAWLLDNKNYSKHKKMFKMALIAFGKIWEVRITDANEIVSQAYTLINLANILEVREKPAIKNKLRNGLWFLWVFDLVDYRIIKGYYQAKVPLFYCDLKNSTYKRAQKIFNNLGLENDFKTIMKGK